MPAQRAASRSEAASPLSQQAPAGVRPGRYSGAVSSCPDQATLRDRALGTLPPGPRAAVDAHVAGCDACRRAVEEVPDTYVPGGPETEEDPPPARLSRYEVRGRIASGGMGKVYEAYDPQLQRKVALKVLRPELLDSAGREHWRARLLREAQAMARLSHPNVLAVHDAGSDGDRVFIAMDLVEGETLTDWAVAAPRSWRAVLGVALQAGDGLAAAHPRRPRP